MAVALETALVAAVAIGVVAVVTEVRRSNREIERIARERANVPSGSPPSAYRWPPDVARPRLDDLFGWMRDIPGMTTTVTTTWVQRCAACKAKNRIKDDTKSGARCGKCGLPLPAAS